VFNGITELALEDTLLEWQEVCHIAAKFPSLTTLHAGSNQLSALTPAPAAASFTSTLVSLHLEFNDFSSLADIAPLSEIPSLRNLNLKLNRISHIAQPSSSPTATVPTPVFRPNLHYVDLSYNNVSTWSFIDALPASFPGLTSLRFTHNPIYDDPDLDNPESLLLPTPAQGQGQGQKGGISKTDESYMLVVARMGPQLKTLNFSAITPADRADADMFYLSRIARQLAAVPEGGPAEKEVLARHPRWAELCELYGEPVVVRQKSVDVNFLEARLITAEFTYCEHEYVGGGGGHGEEDGEEDGEGKTEKKVVKTVQIPKSFDIYAVKGVVGKLFGLSPLRLRLVWESGEWDPVGGFDEVDEESEEEAAEDLAEAEWERRGDVGGRLGLEASELPKKGGRWVKREVELKDGPRQFGYCVDGLEAKIRVERR
jgi:Leucine-rich repeat (LRR) protein